MANPRKKTCLNSTEGIIYRHMELLAMGTKMAISFANIFMTKVETNILSHSVTKPLVGKRFIDDVFLPPLGR